MMLDTNVLDSPLRICLADDHAVVREGLRHVIDAQPDMVVVGEAADGEAALEAVRRHRPHVIVLDLSMPGLGGIATVPRLRDVDPALRVVVLTVHEERAYVRQLLAAGVHGYVVKRSAASALLEAIRWSRTDEPYVDSTVGPATSFGAGHGRGAASRDSLTGREVEVLTLIARGFGNSEISSRLGISVKTVETHRARTMEKMGFRSRADIVRYALSAGLLADTGIAD
jgi:DNA-binding NarL/FixJ family response regulator